MEERALPPLQNRVLPTQDIVSDPARGLFTGNRGILRFNDRRLGVPRWTHPHWIICDLEHPRGKYQGTQPQGRWTPLFFLDEAVALAAGHRPCAYCRPEAYRAYKTAWASAFGPSNHKQIDKALHQARVTRTRAQIRHDAVLGDLPDGAMVLQDGQITLVQRNQLITYKTTGYESILTWHDQPVTVLTPQPTLQVLRHGFQPVLHPSASAAIR